jgi:hypothetical protein
VRCCSQKKTIPPVVPNHVLIGQHKALIGPPVHPRKGQSQLSVWAWPSGTHPGPPTQTLGNWQHHSFHLGCRGEKKEKIPSGFGPKQPTPKYFKYCHWRENSRCLGGACQLYLGAVKSSGASQKDSLTAANPGPARLTWERRNALRTPGASCRSHGSPMAATAAARSVHHLKINHGSTAGYVHFASTV